MEELEEKRLEEANLSFNRYKWHTLCAIKTLYPGRTYEEIEEEIESKREYWVNAFTQKA